APGAGLGGLHAGGRGAARSEDECGEGDEGEDAHGEAPERTSSSSRDGREVESPRLRPSWGPKTGSREGGRLIQAAAGLARYDPRARTEPGTPATSPADP